METEEFTWDEEKRQEICRAWDAENQKRRAKGIFSNSLALGVTVGQIACPGCRNPVCKCLGLP